MWWCGSITHVVCTCALFGEVCRTAVISRNVGKSSQFGATKPLAHPEDGDGVISRNVKKTFTFLVLPNHQHTLKMGTELFPETSENLHSFGATKPPAHPKDGDGVTFTSWRGCLPEKYSLNSVATKASRLINQMLVQYISRPHFSFFYLKVSMFISILKTYGFNTQLFRDYIFVLVFCIEGIRMFWLWARRSCEGTAMSSV